jgi:hypothetical protein
VTTQVGSLSRMALDQGTIDTLDSTSEVHMLTPRRDGSTSSRPIWVVVVEGEAYVRSYRGERGAWYRRTRTDGKAALELDGQTVDVSAEHVGDEETNRKVSDAFRAKYGERSPGPTETMVNAEVSRTTLRLS